MDKEMLKTEGKFLGKAVLSLVKIVLTFAVMSISFVFINEPNTTLNILGLVLMIFTGMVWWRYKFSK